jgi:hypothetical protein
MISECLRDGVAADGVLFTANLYVKPCLASSGPLISTVSSAQEAITLVRFVEYVEEQLWHLQGAFGPGTLAATFATNLMDGQAPCPSSNCSPVEKTTSRVW